jgi:hypothetical protein
VISKSFTAGFHSYDVATMGCREFWAGEFYQGAAGFASGLGPGLFARTQRAGSVPLAIDGTEDYRFYALATWREYPGDGTVDETLVGIGIKTEDLSAFMAARGYSAAQAWRRYTPENLYVLTSSDGEAWTELPLGAIEIGDGPYSELERDRTYHDTLLAAWMTGRLRWQEGLNASGQRCLFIHTRTHRIEFDGTGVVAIALTLNPVVVKVNADNTTVVAPGFINGAARHPSGIDYLSANQKEAEVFVKGQSVVFATHADEDDALIMRRIRPRYSDVPVHFVEGIPTVGETEESRRSDSYTLSSGIENAEHRGLGTAGGKWFALFIKDRVASTGALLTPQFWLESFDEFPAPASSAGEIKMVELDISTAPSVTGTALWGDTSMSRLDFQPATIRGASGRAYCWMRHAGMRLLDSEFAQAAVFEAPANSRPSDFSNTAALRIGDVAYIGTFDGYLYLWHVYNGTVSVLKRIDDSEVLALALWGGSVFALTESGVWWAPDGLAFSALFTASEMSARSLCVLGNRLYIVSSDGTDATVTIYTLDPANTTATLLRTDTYPDTELNQCAVFGTTVYVAGGGGVVVSYSSGAVATPGTVALFDDEYITALFDDGSAQWAGTENGLLFKRTAGTWALAVDTGKRIRQIAKFGDSLLLAHDVASASWSSFKVTVEELTEHLLPRCDGSDTGDEPGATCVGSSFGFVPDDDLPWILTSCGIVPTGGDWPPEAGPSDPPEPGDEFPPELPTPAGVWVSQAITLDAPCERVLFEINLQDAQAVADYDAHLVFVRVERELLHPLNLASYERITLGQWCALQRSGRVVRFLVVPPVDAPALAYSWAFSSADDVNN